MESGEYKKSEPANELAEEHWEAQARSALFRSKRVLEHSPSSFVSTRQGRDAVAKIVSPDSHENARRLLISALELLGE